MSLITALTLAGFSNTAHAESPSSIQYLLQIFLNGVWQTKREALALLKWKVL